MTTNNATAPTGAPDNPLQALIREHMANTGETLAEIAARGQLPRQTVSGLLYRTDVGGMPRAQTITKLAIGLGLSRATVAEAAGQAAAMHAEPEPLDHRVTVLCEIAKTLPVHSVDVLLVTARALARSAGETT